MGKEISGNRPELAPELETGHSLLCLSADVRRILYTTNAIEALNSKLRRAVRSRGHFPGDEAAAKLLFLVLNRSEKEWKIPPREWAMAKTQMPVIFGERFIKAMA